MNKTRIDWCDFTWNPVVGCTGGCPYCYARKMAHRFHRDFTPHWVERNFQRTMPKKPSRIFVNSMSDLADWEEDWVVHTALKISCHPDHLFLFLTKRPWDCIWCPVMDSNSLLGYSATDQFDYDRLVPYCVGRVSFLSIEPLLGPIRWFDSRWKPRWIIVGAETGNRRKRVVPELEWLKEIYRYATRNGVPLFFKESLRAIWWSEPEDGPFFPQEYPV